MFSYGPSKKVQINNNKIYVLDIRTFLTAILLIRKNYPVICPSRGTLLSSKYIMTEYRTYTDIIRINPTLPEHLAEFLGNNLPLLAVYHQFYQKSEPSHTYSILTIIHCKP